MTKLFCSYSPVCLNPHCTSHYSLLTGFANNSFPVKLPKTCCSGRTVAVPSCVWLIRILVSDINVQPGFKSEHKLLKDFRNDFAVTQFFAHASIFYRSSPVAEFSYIVYPSKSVVSVKVRLICKTL